MSNLILLAQNWSVDRVRIWVFNVRQSAERQLYAGVIYRYGLEFKMICVMCRVARCFDLLAAIDSEAVYQEGLR